VLKLAGLDGAKLSPVESRRPPPAYCDSFDTFGPAAAEGIPFTVECGSLDGHMSHFAVVWDFAESADGAKTSLRRWSDSGILSVLRPGVGRPVVPDAALERLELDQRWDGVRVIEPYSH